MSNKHVFSSSDGLVVKSLRGAIALNPGLRLHAPSKSVYVASSSAQVAVISGGGAGHEPAHASYTGAGMLTASVSGDIFASPSSSQILSCIELACTVSPPIVLSFGSHETHKIGQTQKQIILIINNYTGDRLNFGLAAEKARSRGVLVDSVVVADDVSLLSTPSLVGPRGLGGNILVCKVIGAAAAFGKDLRNLKQLGDAVTANLASIGVGLAHCHVPGRRKDTDNGMADDECELGMGLHNEPGAKKMKMRSAEALVEEMLDSIMTSRKRKAMAEGRADAEDFVKTGSENTDDVVLFINNLGGMSQLEMGAVLDETLNQLEKRFIFPIRIYLSSYMTSLNAPGFSISLLNLSSVIRDLRSLSSITNDKVDDYTSVESLLLLLDAPTDALAWVGVRVHWPKSRSNRQAEENDTENLLRFLRSSSKNDSSPLITDSTQSTHKRASINISSDMIKDAIKAACESVLAVESDLTKFDTIAGDGDCGETFASGAKAVLRAIELDSPDLINFEGSALVEALGNILEDSMGGTSGALFGIYFASLSTSLRTNSWDHAPADALKSLSQYTPARPGDRTIIDALYPFCTELSNGAGVGKAAKTAQVGAEGTRGMRARLGRATYVGVEDDSDKELPPDPGAWGVAAILKGLASVFNSE